MTDRNTGLIRAFGHSPMTASTGGFLAQAYFGPGVTPELLAQGLPAEITKVDDFGSGLSTFGHDVCSVHPNITWNNVDTQYTRPLPSQRAAYARYVGAAPPNVAFWRGDVLDISEELREGLKGAQLVLSYNLVPHLLRLDKNLGRIALANLVSLADPDIGRVYVGPTSSHMFSHRRWNTLMLPGDATFEQIDEAARAMESPSWANLYYRGATRSGVGLYPRKRFVGNGGWNIVFSDDGGQTRYNLAQREGWRLAGRLALGLLGRTS